MKRAAIYSRFSTDLQRDRSIEDQVELCRSFCARSGMTVVATFDDRARSGASAIGRDGLFRMVEAARAGAFNVLVVEALDRLSRDQEDLAGLYKRLTFMGVQIVAVHDGAADAVQIGVRGMLGSLYLADLAHKVRRGLAGVVRDGRHAGGRAYGYRPIAGRPGELEIVEGEAEVIRRIFSEYREGASPRSIAAGLNRDRVQPPRGTRWTASTINGNKQRGNGILQNPLYAGRIVWNRVKMVRDPDTGRRVSRVNPEGEWQSADAPHLRIVHDDDMASAAAAKRGRSGEQGRRLPKRRRLLSGLLRCSLCGGGMAITDSDASGPRVQCSTYRESRSCTSTRKYYVGKIERLVVENLLRHFENPELLRAYVDAYRDERRKIEARAKGMRAKTEKRVADANAAIARLVKALASGLMEEWEVAAEMHNLRRERDAAMAEMALAGEETNVVELHPRAVKRFHENLAHLAEIMAGGEEPDREVAAIFRQLVERVIVAPTGPREPYSVEVIGYLSAITGASAVHHSDKSLVAEGGFVHYIRTVRLGPFT